MISSETIRELAVKNQTMEMNVVREYLQNLFLGYFYQNKGARNILFKGGTSLRLIYKSPRYSEDLDFTGFSVKGKDIGNMVRKTLTEVNREGLEMRITESKSTSGGYLSIMEGTAGEWKSRLMVNVSLRSGRQAKEEAILITNPFMPSYTVFSLGEEQIVREKVNALLKRKNPRDFFDLYFMLREGLSRKFLASHRAQLMNEVKGIDNRKISSELKVFLPRSFWPVLNGLRENLIKELGRV